VQDLRQTVSVYWLLRQLKNRTTKEFTFRRMGPFWSDWLGNHIYNIGKAIMRARAIEITKEKAA
jgi:hypothetical protein